MGLKLYLFHLLLQVSNSYGSSKVLHSSALPTRKRRLGPNPAATLFQRNRIGTRMPGTPDTAFVPTFQEYIASQFGPLPCNCWMSPCHVHVRFACWYGLLPEDCYLWPNLKPCEFLYLCLYLIRLTFDDGYARCSSHYFWRSWAPSHWEYPLKHRTVGWPANSTTFWYYSHGNPSAHTLIKSTSCPNSITFSCESHQPLLRISMATWLCRGQLTYQILQAALVRWCRYKTVDLGQFLCSTWKFGPENPARQQSAG